MKEYKQYFKEFIDEIAKYSQSIHKLNKGIVENELIKFEKKFNIRLPYYYKCFLQIANGGELFAIPVGTVLGEVLGDRIKLSGVPYLEYNFDITKRWPDMPDNLFIIADTCDGDMICIDFNTDNGYDCNIVRWSHESGEIEEQWDTLSEWLMNELELGKECINYDGSDKE